MGWKWKEKLGLGANMQGFWKKMGEHDGFGYDIYFKIPLYLNFGGIIAIRYIYFSDSHKSHSTFYKLWF